MTQQSTARSELQRILASISRTQILRTRLKLFCGTCQRMEKVVDVFGTVAKLQCSHRRELEEGIKARIAKLEHEVEREAERARGQEE